MEDRKLRFSAFEGRVTNSWVSTHCFIVLGLLFAVTSVVQADEPRWIWTPKTTVVDSNAQCYFRKKFTLVRPEQAEMELAAGDEYEVYINGRLAIRGESYGTNTKMDVSSFLEPGVNLIAAKVRRQDGDRVGLALRFRVREKGEARWRVLVTDESWKSRIQATGGWHSTAYNDLGWLKASAVNSAIPIVAKDVVSPTDTGSSAVAAQPVAVPPKPTQIPASQANRVSATESNETSPSNEPTSPAIVTNDSEALANNVAPQDKPQPNQPQPKPELETKPEMARSEADRRFDIAPEFSVEPILTDQQTGSLVAMEFDEFGQLLLSKEGGPLLVANLSADISDDQRVRVYCDQVNTCQGILPLNGDVYVTGQGPQGLGLYRLSDTNRDGTLEVVQKLAGFTGKLGEHGPHGLRLGPDGMLYVIVGNASQLDGDVATTSPYRDFYEGDLIQREEDPGGQSVGVKAPGGTIVRISLDGSKVERVAGGIRNAYDLVFDGNGELFFHDSDMEADIGSTWYRPTTVFHVPAGAEFGWRSGWAKFPEHFIDQTPVVCQTGRGSPTGAVVYQHVHFPDQFHDAMFFADWSEGRILAVRTENVGSGFTGQAETFLTGRPLNVVDLAVGQDGGLYFCTGGRGTQGGVYRVVYNGDRPNRDLQRESPLAQVIYQPQPDSAWARQAISEQKVAMGGQWNSAILGVATEKRNTPKVRQRALELMVLYGPAPSPELLEQLAADEAPEIRSQIARICGLMDSPEAEGILRRMVQDQSPVVRRLACESMMRLGLNASLPELKPMLVSLDRIEALTARRMLERTPASQWESEVLQTQETRLFIQGSLALITAEPTLQRAYQILARASTIMEGFVNDRDFVDLLRTMELALVLGEVEPEKIPGYTTRMMNEFPSGSSVINLELARILAYLKAGPMKDRIEEYLKSSEVESTEKAHFVLQMQAARENLSPETRLAFIDTLEAATNGKKIGGSYRGYLRKTIKQLSATVQTDQVQTVFANGHRWPSSVIEAFYQLPDQLDDETVDQITSMDQKMAKIENPSVDLEKARAGVIAVLARSGDQKSMQYLRQIWDQEASRRNDIVIGLAQQPGGENWGYLVSSLLVLDDLTALEVVEKLKTVSRRPRDQRHFRDLITVGYRLRADGATAVTSLLEHWSGETIAKSETVWKADLSSWCEWFEQKWPEEPAIDVPNSQSIGKYSVNDLLAKLEASQPGDAVRGHQIFAKAQCAACHQIQGQGNAVGPNLTNLAQRFSLREILEATLEPSRVIPDRYSSKTILTVDGEQLSGMAIEQSDGSYFMLQSDGKKLHIAADGIDEIKSSDVSAMPTGLLDQLSVSQVNDLMTYLTNPNAIANAANKKTEKPSVSQADSNSVR